MRINQISIKNTKESEVSINVEPSIIEKDSNILLETIKSIINGNAVQISMLHGALSQLTTKKIDLVDGVILAVNFDINENFTSNQITESRTSYKNAKIENELSDCQNHLYISNPILETKNISLELDLNTLNRALFVESYKVHLNGEFIAESHFDSTTNIASVKHLNVLHPLLVDEYHNEWLEFEFEDGTPLHTDLMSEAIKRQLNFSFNSEFGTFEDQFEDGGFRSKLDLYLRGKTIKLWNSNFALPSLKKPIEICSIHESDDHLKVNKKVLTDVLSNLLTTPLDNLNWLLTEELTVKKSA